LGSSMVASIVHGSLSAIFLMVPCWPTARQRPLFTTRNDRDTRATILSHLSFCAAG
jgi:hypothetical protein